MELESSRLLPVDRETAWNALNDPKVLKAAIPGCESIEPNGDGSYTLALVAAVGPVKAKFNGRLTLTDVVAPERYTLTFDAQGGAAGFGKGSAQVELAPEEGGTRLSYRVKAQVGGRIAQVGSRLIDATAKKLADEFFAAFARELARIQGPEAGASPPPARKPFPRARIAAILLLIAALVALGLVAALAKAEEPFRIGSKRFTESYILGEILARAVEREGAPAVHRPGLGNTAILFEALTRGAIDAYPEYTGTIAREILKSDANLDLAGINRRLAAQGLEASFPLGFSNGYALGMRKDAARAQGIERISDLARHPGIALGLSHEFLGRQDGWPGLKAAYRLPQPDPRGIDHGLAYEALAKGEVQVIDLYTTDAKIARYGLQVLEDDRGFFPRYDAVILHRTDGATRFPKAFAALSKLEGRIDAETMIRLNARAELDRIEFPAVAAEYLGAAPTSASRTLWSAVFGPDFMRLAGEHANLVFVSLLAAIAAGVPLGVLAAKVRWIAQPVLIATGLVQTIPSLALLAFLIPVTGSIGAWPALIALFLYALLPIARNTHAGILGVAPGLRQAALAIGLTPRQSLVHVELPLAAPTILAGVKTSAVINVGTATIAAFIGAGGFGERIAQGLALNDNRLLLAGALPAAAFALGVHAIFELAERGLTRHLQPRDNGGPATT